MTPKTTSRNWDYTIQRGHCQLQLCQPRINLAIMGVDVSLPLFFQHFERRNRKAQFIDINFYLFI
jgi:hypothetical protein